MNPPFQFWETTSPEGAIPGSQRLAQHMGGKRLPRNLLAACALTLAAAAPSARGALVTESLTGTVSGGPFASTVGIGSFSYDDSLIVTGDETLGVADGVTLSFSILGQTFTESDDLAFPQSPVLEFDGGTPVFLDFIIARDPMGPGPTPINDPRVLAIIFDEISPDPGGGFAGQVFIIGVPEPASVALFAGLGLGAFAVYRRARSRAGGLSSAAETSADRRRVGPSGGGGLPPRAVNTVFTASASSPRR